MLSVVMPQRRAIQTEFRPIKNLDVAQFEQLLWQSSLCSRRRHLLWTISPSRLSPRWSRHSTSSRDYAVVVVGRRNLSLGGCHRKPSTPNAYAVSSSGSGSAAAVRVTACLTVARADVQINLLTFLGRNTLAINWHLQRTV